MRTTTLSLATNQLITAYGNTAKNVVNAYRLGNARAAGYVEKTWSAAVQKAGKRISGEVRRNALFAQKKLTGLYVQGVTFTTDSADLAINKAVALAGKGVEQAAANATRFEHTTGLSTLSTVARAAVPAVVAVHKVAAQLENQSSRLAIRAAGSKAKAKVSAAKRSAGQAARKAAPRVRKAAAAAQTVLAA
jgi:hypothetical protein